MKSRKEKSLQKPNDMIPFLNETVKKWKDRSYFCILDWRNINEYIDAINEKYN